MALNNLFQSLANTKTRTMILFASVLAMIGIGVSVSQLSGPVQTQTSDAKTLPIPDRLKAIPGNTAPEQYQKLLQEDNAKRVAAAKKGQGNGSAIPTVLGDNQTSITTTPTPDATPIAEAPADNLSKKEQLAKSILAGLDKKAGLVQDPKLAAQQEMIRDQQKRMDDIRKQQKEEEERARLSRQRVEDQKTFQQAVDKLNKSMEAQTKSIFNKWGEIPKQAYNSGILAPTADEARQAWADVKAKGTSSSNRSNSSNANDSSTDGMTVVKAGTILFGVIDTSINSDEPGPVMASIVEGPYKGGKLLGAIKSVASTVNSNPPEKIVVNFTTLSLPNYNKSISISAVAIDPDTARTALASDVDHHYLTRYGFLFASAFMSGYGQAIQQSGSVTTNNPGANTTTTTSPTLSGKDEFYVAMGNVGQQWSQQVAPTFNRPPTITVNAGTGVGLLLLEDLKLPISEG